MSDQGFPLMAVQPSGTEVISVVLVDIVPTRASDSKTLLIRYVQQTRKEPGCKRLELLEQSGHSSNHWALIAVWQSSEFKEAHLARGFTREFREHLQPLLASPLDDRSYTSVG